MLLSHSLICVLFTYFTEKLVAVKEEQLLFSTKPNISSPFIHICVLFTLETTYKIVSTPENNSITNVILLPSQGACPCVVSTVSCIIQFSVSSEDFNFTAIKSAEYLLSLKNFSLTSISPSSHHSFIPLLSLIKLLKDFVCFPIFTLKVKVTHLCLPLCDPMGYKVHGILQARKLEWIAFPFSRGSSQPRGRT